MARTKPDGSNASKVGALTAWVNRTLFPWIGPPPLGPYNVVPEEDVKAAQAASVCPICGELMSVHEIDRSGERTQIYHPTPEQAAERRAAL
ncbi:hypothetical protein [Glaciibacter sp. 2TAF33]|uniref:hypothetical protein n=1 Tax=Glaciibacter sp. 2TAF33 TaxID=3233015 RepID=UPI003F920366